MAERPPLDTGLQWHVHGVRGRFFEDLYPRLMGASWTATIALAFAAYSGVCVLFAGLFALESDGVKGAAGFTDLLWFSVQTLSTIGYGGMTPVTGWANGLVLVESFIGLAGVAVVTAILYAKFSLPAARVRFSNALAIHDRGDVPTLHLRMLNERTTPILDVELHVGVLVDDSSGDDGFRRLVDLELARSHVPVFAMAFTLMHVMDATSPLHDLQDHPERMIFLIVTLRGIDERTLQPVYARAMFRHEHIALGQGFADVMERDPEGQTHVHVERLDDLVPRALTLGPTKPQVR